LSATGSASSSGTGITEEIAQRGHDGLAAPVVDSLSEAEAARQIPLTLDEVG
jgi:hypothetical protein